MDNNELKHHGILGQKWGVRRYQNYDGSLTELGKRRLGRSSNSSGKASSNKKTPSTKTVERQMKQDVRNRSSMTNQELREKIEHLRLQRELRTLTDEELRPGKAAFDNILKQVGTRVAVTALSGAALYGLKAAITKEKFDNKAFAKAITSGNAGGGDGNGNKKQ